jgi:hypothetical protein
MFYDDPFALGLVLVDFQLIFNEQECTEYFLKIGCNNIYFYFKYIRVCKPPETKNIWWGTQSCDLTNIAKSI